MVEDGDPVADAHHDLHVVLDEQDREPEACSELADELGQPPGLLGVHARGRLIEEQQLRFGRQGARDLESPLIAIRQVAGERVLAAPEPDQVEQLHRAGVGLFLLTDDRGRLQDRPEPAALEPMVEADQHVVLGRHVPEQADVLERACDPDPDDLVRLVAGDVGPVEGDPTLLSGHTAR